MNASASLSRAYAEPMAGLCSGRQFSTPSLDGLSTDLVKVVLRVEEDLVEAIPLLPKVAAVPIRELVQHLRKIAGGGEVEAARRDDLPTCLSPRLEQVVLRPETPRGRGVRYTVVAKDRFGLETWLGGRYSLLHELAGRKGEGEGAGRGGFGEVGVQLGQDKLGAEGLALGSFVSATTLALPARQPLTSSQCVAVDDGDHAGVGISHIQDQRRWLSRGKSVRQRLTRRITPVRTRIRRPTSQSISPAHPRPRTQAEPAFLCFAGCSMPLR